MKKILLLLGVIAVFILNCGNEGKQQENGKKESKKKFIHHSYFQLADEDIKEPVPATALKSSVFKS